MSLPTALFLDKASVYPQDLDFSSLEKVANWQWFDLVNINDVHHSLQTAEILVSNKVVLDESAFQYCANLKPICVAATGVNNVDLRAATRHNIKVCNVRAYATASVVQHVFSLILSLNRKLQSYQHSVQKGDWTHSDFFCYFGEPISDLENKTLGIIGFGELGKAVAKVAETFGMRVLIAKRNAEDGRSGRVDLSQLLAESDIVSLHCALSDENYYLIDKDELAMMKPGAMLINTARGGLINESALLEALHEKKIIAGLDVLEQEPPAVNHKLSNYSGDNLILTPHIAWASVQSRQRLIDEIAKNIECYQHGEDRNQV